MLEEFFRLLLLIVFEELPEVLLDFRGFASSVADLSVAHFSGFLEDFNWCLALCSTWLTNAFTLKEMKYYILTVLFGAKNDQ